MPLSKLLTFSAERIKRTENRLRWQQRLVDRTADPVARQAAFELLQVYRDALAELRQSHGLLMEMHDRAEDRIAPVRRKG